MLCRQKFTSIIHNVKSEREYDEVKIPITDPEELGIHFQSKVASTVITLQDQNLAEDLQAAKISHCSISDSLIETSLHSTTNMEAEMALQLTWTSSSVEMEDFNLNTEEDLIDVVGAPKKCTINVKTNLKDVPKENKPKIKKPTRELHCHRHKGQSATDSEKEKIIQQILSNQTAANKKKFSMASKSEKKRQVSTIPLIDTPRATPSSTDNEAEQIIQQILAGKTKPIFTKKKTSATSKSKKKKKKLPAIPLMDTPRVTPNLTDDEDDEQIIQKMLAEQTKRTVAKNKSNTTQTFKNKRTVNSVIQTKGNKLRTSPNLSVSDIEKEELIQQILADQIRQSTQKKKTDATKLNKKQQFRIIPSMNKTRLSRNSSDTEEIIQEILANQIKSPVGSKERNKVGQSKKRHLSKIQLQNTAEDHSPNCSKITSEDIIQEILAANAKFSATKKKSKASRSVKKTPGQLPLLKGKKKEQGPSKTSAELFINPEKKVNQGNKVPFEIS